MSNLSDEVVEELDNIGSTRSHEYSQLIPISGSDKQAIAGESGDVSAKYVGHAVVCTNLNEVGYQVQKRQKHILSSVEGRGVAISEKIIQSLRTEYNATYVFVGIRETDDVLVIPLDRFSKDWHSKLYDKQKYARLDRDVVDYIYGSMSKIFSEHPDKSLQSITNSEAQEMIS